MNSWCFKHSICSLKMSISGSLPVKIPPVHFEKTLTDSDRPKPGQNLENLEPDNDQEKLENIRTD